MAAKAARYSQGTRGLPFTRQAKQPTTKVRQGINKLRGTPPRRNLNI